MRRSVGFLGAIALFFMIVPGFAAMHSIYKITQANRIAFSGVGTSGTVIDVHTYDTGGRSGGGGQTHVAFEFRTADGRKEIGRQQIAMGRVAFEEGETISVRYLPDAPHRSVIDSFMGRFSWVFALLFTVPFFAGLAWLVRRDMQEQEEMPWARRRF